MQLSGSGNRVLIYKDATISGNLDVGSGGSSKISVHAANNGYTGFAELKARSRYDVYLNLQTTRVNGGWMYLKINNDNFLLLSSSGQFVKHFKPIIAQSDDRLKENEVVIESACGILSKLRPQFYDKKPDMENTDSTIWVKESGLIAQEIYYDAPELRHLVNRGDNEFDKDGNEIPLPEIPTSVDPQHDPDYSSWGKEAASVNYIGFIEYVIKANNELHERVKALGSK